MNKQITLNKTDILIRKILIKWAKQKQTIAYNELIKAVGVPRQAALKSLTQIDLYEHSFCRPMLCSLVVSARNHMSSKGFLSCCRRRGLRADSTPHFWWKQFSLCCEFWQNEENYVKYYDYAVVG